MQCDGRDADVDADVDASTSIDAKLKAQVAAVDIYGPAILFAIGMKGMVWVE